MADFKTYDGYKLKDVQGRETLGEIEAYIGYPDDNVLGLAADFENSTFTRLAAAKGLNAGSDFNTFKMYGDRKLCNLADDGTITAWYGDPNYTETGYTTIVDPDTQEESTIQVQVMVRQPKFYYKVVPIKLEPITSTDPTQTGVHGYSGVKMNYYISDKPLPGFKLHPAFINANGDEVDCYYIGAYEGSLYDASESEYRVYDTWDVSESGGVYTVNALNAYLAVADNDKLCSIAGVKPASGEYSTQFTRPNANKMAKNRGTGWGSLNVKIASAEQLLFAMEYASFNSQSNIGRGVVDYGTSTHNTSAFTGSTSSIGNGTGMAESTTRLLADGTYNAYTRNGYVSVRYRGVENFYGNQAIGVDGINITSRVPYICADFDYAEQTYDDNYESVGCVIPTSSTSGDWYDSFIYNERYDWLMMPANKGGNSSLPIGDMYYIKTNNVIPFLGGNYLGAEKAGAFLWYMNETSAFRSPNYTYRLIYIK